jgi:hypothetical protein
MRIGVLTLLASVVYGLPGLESRQTQVCDIESETTTYGAYIWFNNGQDVACQVTLPGGDTDTADCWTGYTGDGCFACGCTPNGCVSSCLTGYLA